MVSIVMDSQVKHHHPEKKAVTPVSLLSLDLALRMVQR